MKWFLALLITSNVLAQTASTIGITRGNFLRKPEYATQGALNLYVETTGNDANFCTDVSAPCLTIQGAVDKVPKLIRHPVIIAVGQGTFGAGAYISAFLIDKAADPSVGAYMQVFGTLINGTPATGPATGTATSGTAGTTDSVTWGTLTLTGAGWTVNDLRGKLLEITGGTGSGQIRSVYANTADTITVAGDWTAPTGTSTFAIRDWGTTINGVVTSPLTPGNAAGSLNASFIISEASSKTQAEFWLTVDKFKYAISSGRALRSDGMANFIARYSYFGGSSTTSGRVSLGRGGGVYVYASYASLPSGVDLAVAFNNQANTGRFFIERNVVDTVGAGGIGRFEMAPLYVFYNHVKNTSGRIVGLGSNPNVVFRGNIFDCNGAGGVGIEAAGSAAPGIPAAQRGSGPIRFTGNDISNCATAIKVKGDAHVYFEAGVVSGTGNTTGISVEDMATVWIESDTTLTGTTELSIEGAAYTLAGLRALSPKRITDVSTGAGVSEP